MKNLSILTTLWLTLCLLGFQLPKISAQVEVDTILRTDLRIISSPSLNTIGVDLYPVIFTLTNVDENYNMITGTDSLNKVIFLEYITKLPQDEDEFTKMYILDPLSGLLITDEYLQLEYYKPTYDKSTDQ